MTDDVATSRWLSWALRHAPQEAGIILDAQGWTRVEALLAAATRNGHPLTREWLDQLVRTNSKQRFAFNADGSAIRANQGHSVDVDLALDPVVPPPVLYHGTVAAAAPAIRRDGLIRRSRQHVHLSADRATAEVVGGRRGVPVILLVDAAAMHRDGLGFFRSANGVWLTDAVPPRYLREAE